MLEFPTKESLAHDSDISNAIIGLTNTEGGYLYPGIEDNGPVTGLHNNHKKNALISFFCDNTQKFLL